jgi:hypothetical protein
MRYFDVNRREMLAGAVIYWPLRYSIFDLMLRRAEIGHSAFAAEYQGVPGSGSATEWPAELFDRPGFWFDQWPAANDVAMRIQALDPSKGTGAKSSDYQAHVMIVLHRDGTFYVDCELRREPGWCARALDIAMRFYPREIVAEGNCTMGLMLPEMTRLIAERPKTEYRPAIMEVLNTVPKLTRMRWLTGYLQRGQIRVRNSTGGRLLVEQMRDVPNGAHDDGVDGLATGILRMQKLYHGGS